MKNIALLFSILFNPFCGELCQAQTYQWAKGGGTTELLTLSVEREKVQQMCTDANGNIYVLGNVGGSSGYAIAADTFYRPTGAYGNNRNVFLSSYTCDGQMRWAKLISSSTGSAPYGITTDELGHVYVSGSFQHVGGPLHVGYDTVFTTVGYLRIGLIQFDTSGEYNWMRFVGDNTAFATSALATQSDPIAIDADNRVHFVCYMRSGVTLSPTVTSVRGTYDLIYDPAGLLTAIHHLQLDSTLCPSGIIGGGGISLDKESGKMYMFGRRQTSFSSMSDYPFVAAFDSAGNEIWEDTLAAISFGGPGYASFCGIAADEIGHLYVTGAVPAAVAYQGFNIGTTPSAGWISFIMKLDTQGNHIWHRSYTATTSINALYGISFLPNNKIASSGVMAGVLSSGPFSTTSYSGEGQNSFFTIVDSAGYLFKLEQVHGSGFYDGSWANTADNKGNFYFGGEVEASTWGGTMTPYTTVGGPSDFYVMKYGMGCSCTTLPVASFTDTGTIARGFFYTGTTTSVDSVRWDFGDGGTSTLMDPIHTYTAGDTFDICVRVYTPCGSDMSCKTIIIPCVGPPVAAFAMSGTGLTRTFTYTGGTPMLDSVTWTFTDGGTATGTPVAHAFPAAGAYTACVTAHSPCGPTTTCNPITITCTSSPVSAYTVSPGAGLTKTFTYTGTTLGLDSVTWTFGDGGTASGLTPMHTFSAAGTYTICAKVWTNCGTHTWCNSLVVTCTSTPVSSFTSSGSGLTKFFIYTGTTAGMDSVTWTFGDGGVATGTTPSHTYAMPGTYTVCAKVWTNCGTHTACSSIVVTCTSTPTASFTVSGSGAIRAFTYTGTTTPAIDSVRWDFGDGGTSTLMSPSHTYTTEDTFHVCVTVYTMCGSNTSCQDVIVTCFTPVTADFTDTGVLVHGFAYSGTMAGYDSVVWTFGDGGTDTGLNVIHTYAVADTYNVCATVFTDCGTHTWCKDVILGSVGIPEASLSAISVFPNPSRNELTVANVPKQMDYRIVNVVGVVMQQGALNAGGNTLPIDALPVGTYQLELSGVDGSRKVARFVKM